MMKIENSTTLRVGIKWYPIQRDELQESSALSESESIKELQALRSELKSLWWFRKILFATYIFRNTSRSLGRTVDLKKKKIETIKQYLSEAGIKSRDLDLCCCCYDKSKRMVKFVSPRTTDTQASLDGRMAFVHSGDDETGTGGLYDEELRITLAAMAPEIQHVFLVIASVNYGFHEIGDFHWSIVSTREEKELLALDEEANTSHRIHVMARLSREGFAWTLEKIAEYLPLEINGKSTLGEQLNDLIMRRFFTPTKYDADNA